ncbi:MAG: tail fiber domain-containing protein [Elusimicrobiota bacterium]
MHSGNPVDWTKLKNVPAGFADGVDDTGTGSSSQWTTSGSNIYYNSGNVGIGTTAPSATLEVKVGGTTLADAWTPRSSKRWKTNIKPISAALDKINQLQGVSFDWKETQKHDIGLIAEDVGKIIPEVVDYEENGKDAKSLNYDHLVAVLVEAVKEQQKKIEELESRLNKK